MKKNTRLYAAIDIGSHRLRMKIVQIQKDGSTRDLENVDQLVPLGRDTFNDGKLSFESVRATCAAIVGFKQLMTDYGVAESRVVATSALREATNRDYMIDQIRMLTGFDVEIINNAQEKFFTYQAVKKLLLQNLAPESRGTLILLDIGAGNIQLSQCENLRLITSQSMKIGALRINEAMSKIEKHTLRFYKVLEEYIEAHVENIESFQGVAGETFYAVVTGESESLEKLTGCARVGNVSRVGREPFDKTFKKASGMSAEALAELCDVSMADAEIIAPSLILMRKFFDKTAASELLLPFVTLVDGLIAEHLLKTAPQSESMVFEEDILSNASHIAQRYHYNEKHTTYITSACLMLFDGLQSVHNMTKRDRFLLQVAALLHDIGKFIGADPHCVYSYNIIKASQLSGLSDGELATVANIARFHSAEEPASNNESIRKLDAPSQIKAVKMIALIRVADAMDTSHKQKIHRLRIQVPQDGVCKIQGQSKEETALEQWTFQTKSEFFHEVFGIKPVLLVTNVAGKQVEEW